MRTALATVLSLAIAAPAMAANICEYQPPLDMRQEPTVAYQIVEEHRTTLPHYCGVYHPDLLGCAVPGFDAWGEEHWTIYVRANLDSASRACVISHEKGHLPPNNWLHE